MVIRCHTGASSKVAVNTPIISWNEGGTLARSANCSARPAGARPSGWTRPPATAGSAARWSARRRPTRRRRPALAAGTRGAGTGCVSRRLASRSPSVRSGRSPVRKALDGESLGEKNLYMHGLPLSLAPREQYEIPFIVWTSDNSSKQLKTNSMLSQNHVFHSVLNFLGVQSPVYNEDLNIFK